jgi:hypothetical protein
MVGSVSPTLMGRLSRPASAGFVTWNSPGVADDTDSFVGIDDDVTVASDSQAPLYGTYRTQGTPGAQSIPTRPTSAAVVVPTSNTNRATPSSQPLVWDTPIKSPKLEPTSPVVESGGSSVNNIRSSSDGALVNRPITATGAVTTADIIDDVAASTPSKKVNALREATNNARSDLPWTSPETTQPIALFDSSSSSLPKTASVTSPLLANLALTTKGPVAIKTKIIGIPIPAAFADFVECDKYFEAATAKFAELEFDRRLEVLMEQTTRRNALYVAMTKVYLRWAETGLEPSQPDPPSHEEMQRLILRDEQHRRNVDNIILKESKGRQELSDTLLTALTAMKNTLYLLMEEEAVRAHLVTVYEPQRWSSLTFHIYHFLETRLVTASLLWKAWSLAGGVIEREEGWDRAMLNMKFEVLAKTLKFAKIEQSECNSRSVVEREERVSWNSVEYAGSVIPAPPCQESVEANAAVRDHSHDDGTSAEVTGEPDGVVEPLVVDSTNPEAEEPRDMPEKQPYATPGEAEQHATVVLVESSDEAAESLPHADKLSASGTSPDLQVAEPEQSHPDATPLDVVGEHDAVVVTAVNSEVEEPRGAPQDEHPCRTMETPRDNEQDTVVLVEPSDKAVVESPARADNTSVDGTTSGAVGRTIASNSLAIPKLQFGVSAADRSLSRPAGSSSSKDGDIPTVVVETATPRPTYYENEHAQQGVEPADASQHEAEEPVAQPANEPLVNESPAEVTPAPDAPCSEAVKSAATVDDAADIAVPLGVQIQDAEMIQEPVTLEPQPPQGDME